MSHSHCCHQCHLSRLVNQTRELVNTLLVKRGLLHSVRLSRICVCKFSICPPAQFHTLANQCEEALCRRKAKTAAAAKIQERAGYIVQHGHYAAGGEQFFDSLPPLALGGGSRGFAQSPGQITGPASSAASQTSAQVCVCIRLVAVPRAAPLPVTSQCPERWAK